MIDFCVLGSGIAGSTIANLLSKKYSVHVFDKARGAGGRSSNKKLKGNLSFDHGVQYISPKSKVFTKIKKRKYKFKDREMDKSFTLDKNLLILKYFFFLTKIQELKYQSH